MRRFMKQCHLPFHIALDVSRRGLPLLILASLVALAGCTDGSPSRTVTPTSTGGTSQDFPRHAGHPGQPRYPDDAGGSADALGEPFLADTWPEAGPGTSGDDLWDEGESSTGCPTDCGIPDDAVVVAASFTTELSVGEEATGVVAMRNTGTATWTRAEGYKLGAVDSDDPFKVGDTRVWLSEEDIIPPGGEYTFLIPMKAGDQVGVFTTDWRMVHEGVTWFGETTAADIEVQSPYPLSLPNMSATVQAVAAAHPEWLANSCQDDGGTWEFMDVLVDELRLTDKRWGYNWKRGVIGDPSEDVVDYHYGPGEHEGSTEVYILDVIVGHCGPNPAPGWMDQTQVTLDADEIGMWTGRGRF